MNKMDIYDIADRLTNYTNQLDNITESLTTNINNLNITKCKETDRLYFLNDYIKQISNDLYKFSSEIIKDDAKWYWLMEYQHPKS